MLPESVQSDLAARGYTRRGFLKAASLLAGASTFSFYNEASMAQLSSLGGALPDGAVKINANENPLGPAPEALDALMAIAKNGGRYSYEETHSWLSTAAELEGLERDNFAGYPGSSLPLHFSVIAFTGPTAGLVTADPGYEAAARAAEFVGAPVTRVPLKPESAAHDIRAMVAAAKAQKAGMIYICNPNNPTGTVSPREEIEWAVKNKPKDTVILLDEAYIHFSDEPMGTDFVKNGDDVILLRTFSKLYGMAGLRAGMVVARPDLVKRVGAYQAGALPVTGVAAAHASLKAKSLVPERKALNAEVRDGLAAFFKQHGFAYTPSVSSKIMVDTGMPVRKVIEAMAQEQVYIGRPWPVWPTHARISIGSAEEMERFKEVFLHVTKKT